MSNIWDNDRLFHRLAYGLGGPSPREIVETDNPRFPEPVDPSEALPQPVRYPATRDYDSDDNLFIDGPNQKMPYHEGSADKDAERGHDLGELVYGRPEAPLSDASRWPESYSSDNQYEDADLRLGQRAPWVAVDLDGTILEEPPKGAPEYGSMDVQLPLGAPKPGAVEALNELAGLGWRISIYTARFGDEELDEDTVGQWAAEISEHLEENGVPFSDIWVGRKPRADYFVDDKAVRFEGDWQAILSELAVEDNPPRAEEEDGTIEVEGDRGPLDYPGDPNNLNDPLGDRRNNGIGRPPEFEEALYG